MSIQLIFVVEANKKSKSDWMYISDTIKRFYEKNLINNIKPDRLTANNYKMEASNIMNVLDKYLIRK